MAKKPLSADQGRFYLDVARDMSAIQQDPRAWAFKALREQVRVLHRERCLTEEDFYRLMFTIGRELGEGDGLLPASTEPAANGHEAT